MYGVGCEAEEATQKLTGQHRLTSEHDATVVTTILWCPKLGNLHRMGVSLAELKGAARLENPLEWLEQAGHVLILSAL